ncbi:hypothetical protein FLACOL7796_02283 [Flavobacterium collinsii]|uniref:Uncharacterized protein n=1 Tax=Flavobacterium collinsii TaxID=1114861 RepID=A0ABM8KIQ9_9FLAO|nr:hypothetical protein FLACOL7796_02283 [Flavobacterium collinsii]
MDRAYGSFMVVPIFYDGLKSVATILFEPMALYDCTYFL